MYDYTEKEIEEKRKEEKENLKLQKEQGKEFIVYKGTEFKEEALTAILKEKYEYPYMTKTRTIDDVFFVRVGHRKYLASVEPYLCDSDNFASITVSDPEKYSEFRYNALNRLRTDGLSDEEIPGQKSVLYMYRLIGYLYKKYGIYMFNMFKYYDFSAVFYSHGRLIAGITEPNHTLSILYYGYTPEKSEIMISNSREILERFCDRIYKLPNHSVLADGGLVAFDEKGEEYEIEPTELTSKDLVSALQEEVNSLKKENSRILEQLRELKKMISQYSSDIQSIENDTIKCSTAEGPLKKL